MRATASVGAFRLLAGAVLLLCLTCSTAAAAYSAEFPRDRVIKDGRISESSGLAVSLLHPGVLWTHNDSGHPPRIFAIAKDGTTAATITVPGEAALDWEAITSQRIPVKTGTPYIAIGDIGDNNYQHATSRIVIIPEPKNLVTQSIRPQRVIRFTYPNGPHNAEALLADPRTGQLFVVTKEFLSSQLFAVPRSVWPGRTTGVSSVVTLEPIASSSASLITDGTFLPDGRMLWRNYGRIYLLDNPDQAQNGRLRPLRSASLPDQDQGESLTVEDGGKLALIGSEGEREPVIQIDLTAMGMSSGTSADTPIPAPSNGTQVSPSTATGSTEAGGDRGSRFPISIAGKTWLGVAVGAAAIVLLVAGFVILVSRRP